MKKEILEIRDGIFANSTRRFGSIAELIIEKIFNLQKSRSIYYDRYDEKSNKRVEIKFSRALKLNESVITDKNIIDECKKANINNRLLMSDEIYGVNFDCNIQQVKTEDFDILYYGVFFLDRIAIFKMESNEIKYCPGFSNKQHKGNKGEGQFHLNHKTIKFHMKNNFDRWITYEDAVSLFSEKKIL